MNKIPVNLTISQLKKIVEEAESNQEFYYFADDVITFNVESDHVKVVQPVAGVFGERSGHVLLEKTINKNYSL